MNGGAKKSLLISGIGMAVSGLGYIVAQVNKVEPLAVRVEAVDAKLDVAVQVQEERKRDQEAWNNLFLRNQQETQRDVQEILRAVKRQ